MIGILVGKRLSDVDGVMIGGDDVNARDPMRSAGV